MLFAERIAEKIEKFGEEFTVGSNTYRGVFKILDSGTMRNYLDDVEMMGVTHPGLLLVTDADAGVEPDDTITRDGRIYTVLKVSNNRIGGAIVVKIAILA